VRQNALKKIPMTQKTTEEWSASFNEYFRWTDADMGSARFWPYHSEIVNPIVAVTPNSLGCEVTLFDGSVFYWDWSHGGGGWHPKTAGFLQVYGDLKGDMHRTSSDLRSLCVCLDRVTRLSNGDIEDDDTGRPLDQEHWLYKFNKTKTIANELTVMQVMLLLSSALLTERLRVVGARKYEVRMARRGPEWTQQVFAMNPEEARLLAISSCRDPLTPEPKAEPAKEVPW